MSNLDRAAKTVTGLFNPLFIGAPLTLLLLYISGLSPYSIAFWTFISISVIFLPTGLYLKLSSRYKSFEDVKQENRTPVYLLFLVETSVVFGLTYALGTPPFLQKAALATLLSGIIGTLLNQKVKLSIHTGALSGAAGLALLKSPETAAILLSLTTISVWSRYRLKRHTPRELITGFFTPLVPIALILLVY